MKGVVNLGGGFGPVHSDYGSPTAPCVGVLWLPAGRGLELVAHDTMRAERHGHLGTHESPNERRRVPEPTHAQRVGESREVLFAGQGRIVGDVVDPGRSIESGNCRPR